MLFFICIFNSVGSHSSELDLLVVGGLCLGDGILIEVSLEESGEDSSEERSDNIGSLVSELSFWGSWVDSSVHHFLENWLNDSNCWVKAST